MLVIKEIRMSSMLEQAIIDAEQLKETAQRTAEEAVIEKYQSEIKEAVNAILEQEEPMEEEAALEVTEEGELSVLEDLPTAQLAEEDDIVEINLDKLEELLAQEMEEGNLDASDLSDRHEVAEEMEALTEKELDEEIELDEDINDLLEEDDIDEIVVMGKKGKVEMTPEEAKKEGYLEEELDEELEISEQDLVEAIKEMLGRHAEGLGPDVEGEEAEEESAEAKAAAATSATPVDTLEEVEDLEEEKKPDFPDVDGDGDTKEPISKAQKDKKEKEGDEDKKDKDYSKVPPQLRKHMQKESRLLQKENKTLLREQKKMSNKVQLLENKVQKYGTVIEQLKQKLDESNLSNAKLLYQNRILNSISLNERQKNKIVEAVSNATTVEEAKIIFETLQSAVGLKSKKTRKQESLDEVVTRSSSAFIPRKEVKPNTDAFSDRMKRLAGLK